MFNSSSEMECCNGAASLGSLGEDDYHEMLMNNVQNCEEISSEVVGDCSLKSSASSSNNNVRKSERLAEKERPIQARPVYIPGKYSITEKWCDECQATYPQECSKHFLASVPDKTILPRALASLPGQLFISKIYRTTDRTRDSDKTTTSTSGGQGGGSKHIVTSKGRKKICNGVSCHGEKKVARSGRNSVDRGRTHHSNGGNTCGGKNGDGEVNPPAADGGGDRICNGSLPKDGPSTSSAKSVSGVFARRAISARTQFGPLVCKFVNEKDVIGPQSFCLLLEKEDGSTHQADISDENICNWMMFVRPAGSINDQNLVAFQHCKSIYYVSIKNIEPNQELKVWYARPYANHCGFDIFVGELKQEPGEMFEGDRSGGHDSSDDDDDGDDDDCSCYEYVEKFPNEVMLQKHPSLHRPDPVLNKGANVSRSSRKIGKRKVRISEKGDVYENVMKFEAKIENDDDCTYHPSMQKKKTLTFQNSSRLKKRKPLLANHSKGKNSSISVRNKPKDEWSCPRCDLVFNDSTLLNLHALVHAAENAGESSGGGNSPATDGIRIETDLPVLERQSEVLFTKNDSTGNGEQFINADNANSHLMSLVSLTCPACHRDFETKTALVLHVGQHGTSRQLLVCSRPFKCQLCLKTFGSFERLQHHLLCHGDESLKPLVCEVCNRRFMNPAALAVHMKTHGNRKYYTCPLCPESFDQIQQLRSHAEERHLERTIKTFHDISNDGGNEQVFETIGTSSPSDTMIAYVPGGGTVNTGHFDPRVFSGDSSRASVAIAAATRAITSGAWATPAYPIVSVPTNGGLDMISDVGQCFFAEEIASMANGQVAGSNQALADDADLQRLLELNNSTSHGTESVGAVMPVTPKDSSPVAKSRVEGTYHCPECHRVFSDFSAVSRHLRLLHSGRSFECKDCGRSFPRRDKLSLHALRHSSHREFVCETCGRQFKRKDKLRDHLRRQHDPAKEASARKKNSDVPTFTPSISPLEFMKFIFKCQKCSLGFKRRGMLVNHLAKKHPDMPLDSIPELNLPILTSRHDFFCQYCNKVFKSSSKRKVHILKHHPGFELPASLRSRKSLAAGPSSRGKSGIAGTPSALPNATFSTPIGHLASEPHSCNMCHRQYVSRSKLVQHQRKKHGPSGDKTTMAYKSSKTSVADKVDANADGAENPRVTTTTTTASSLEVDCSQFFVGASVFFAPKAPSSLDFSTESDLTSGNVLVLSSNGEELLIDGSAQLGYAKPVQSSFVKQQRSHLQQDNYTKQTSQHNYTKPQLHQTVVIDPDLFAQAMSELTKTYAAKNSATLARYDGQRQQLGQESSQSDESTNQLMDIISLTVDGGTDFSDHQQQNNQLIRSTLSSPATTATTVVASPFIRVVDWGVRNSIQDATDPDPFRNF